MYRSIVRATHDSELYGGLSTQSGLPIGSFNFLCNLRIFRKKNYAQINRKHLTLNVYLCPTLCGIKLISITEWVKFAQVF